MDYPTASSILFPLVIRSPQKRVEALHGKPGTRQERNPHGARLGMSETIPGDSVWEIKLMNGFSSSPGQGRCFPWGREEETQTSMGIHPGLFSQGTNPFKAMMPGRGGENRECFGLFLVGEEQFRSHSNPIKRVLGKPKVLWAFPLVTLGRSRGRERGTPCSRYSLQSHHSKSCPGSSEPAAFWGNLRGFDHFGV